MDHHEEKIYTVEGEEEEGKEKVGGRSLLFLSIWRSLKLRLYDTSLFFASSVFLFSLFFSLYTSNGSFTAFLLSITTIFLTNE